MHRRLVGAEMRDVAVPGCGVPDFAAAVLRRTAEPGYGRRWFLALRAKLVSAADINAGVVTWLPLVSLCYVQNVNFARATRLHLVSLSGASCQVTPGSF